MAIYHLTTKVFSRGKGQSAIAAAAYRSGERLRDEATGEQKFYTARATRIEFTGMFLPPDAPEWARDRNTFWNRAEQAETRKDGRLAREIEVSLPHELTDEQRLYLVKDFVREAFVRKGYAADVAIHAPDQDSDDRNHHAHILISERRVTPDGFAALKDRDMNSKAQLGEWREKWADLANRHLERQGHAERIDHRSLEVQGIDREATVHVGYAGMEITQRGGQSDRMEALLEVLARNGERIELRQDMAAIESELKAMAFQPQDTGTAIARVRAETEHAPHFAREEGRPDAPIPVPPPGPTLPKDQSRASRPSTEQAPTTPAQRSLEWAESPGMVAQQRSATKAAQRVNRDAVAREPDQTPSPRPDHKHLSDASPVQPAAPQLPSGTTSPTSVTVERMKLSQKVAAAAQAEEHPLTANEAAASANDPALRARYNKQEQRREATERSGSQTPAETRGGKSLSPSAPAEKQHEMSEAERRLFEELTRGMRRFKDEQERRRSPDGGRGGRGRSR